MLVSATLGLLAAACGGPADRPASPAGGTVEAATRVLGELTSPTAPLRVQIVDVHRVKSDTLRLELVVHNLAPPGSPGAAGVAEALGALGALSLVTADRQRRLFPLHDPDGRPVAGPIEVPEPGGRRSIWMLFPSPGDGGPVTVVLPGLGTVADVPVR